MIRASVRLSIVSILVAAVSLSCQLLTAHTFGVRHQYDVYLFAISIPFLVMGAAAGAVSQAFVPRLMTARQDSTQYSGSVSALFLFALMAAILVALGGILVTMCATRAMQTFSEADRDTIFQIARVAWTTAGLSILVSALTAVHHTEKSFLIPALINAVPYLGMISAMALFSSQYGAIILSWGMLTAYGITTLILLPKTLRYLSWNKLLAGQLHALFGGAGRVILVIVANCAFTGMAPVEAFLAPRFGPGALSSLGYSQRLIIAMGAVLVAGPSVLLVPAIAEARVGNTQSRVNELAGKSIAATCVIATLAATMFGILRVPLIRLVLQHGAFDAKATMAVAATLPWMLVGSVAVLGAQIAFRALYGQDLHAFPAIAGVMVPLLYFLLGLFFSSAIGFQGICVAYVVSWWLVFAAMLVKLFGLNITRVRVIVHTRTLAIGGALAASALIAKLAGRILLPVVETGSNLVLAVRCCAIVALSLVTFLLIAATAWPISRLCRLKPRSAPKVTLE